MKPHYYAHLPLTALAGDTLQVLLEHPSKVMLLAPEEYSKFQNLDRFEFRGGYADSSPVYIKIPYDGDWHLVVDAGGIFTVPSVRRQTPKSPEAKISR